MNTDEHGLRDVDGGVMVDSDDVFPATNHQLTLHQHKASLSVFIRVHPWFLSFKLPDLP